MDGGLILARFVHYVALALAFGAVAYGYYGNRETLPGLSRSLSRLAVIASVGVLFGAHAVLAATVAGLGGGPQSLADHELWAIVLGETDFGKVWIVRLGLAVVLLAATVALARTESRLLRHATVAVAALLVASVALTGHAASLEGPSGLVHRGADAVHLLASAVWIGALLPLLLLLRSRRTEFAAAPHAARRLHEFHTVGLVAVVLLVGSGLVNSWFLVGGLPELVSTTYGRVLLLKLGLFAVMLGLAARNRLHGVPRLRRLLDGGADVHSAANALRMQITVEFVVSLLVLLAVAVLGTLAPGSGS